MYKVFVVDDEIVIREGLRTSFHWEENGFILVGEAPDGEIALPMIRDEKPDILITDIHMPFMDGLELCKEVRRVMPWVQIVILSGYDNFEYAKQAISLGVQDYLLKPISSMELGQVLNKLIQRIEQERHDANDLNKLRQQMATGKLLMRDQVIRNAVLNGITESEGKQVCEQMRPFGVNLNSPCYTVIEFRSGELVNYADMHAALIPLVERSCETVFLCSNEVTLNALVLGDSEKDIEERAYSFARSALDELDRAGYSDSRASIGEITNSFWNVHQSYKSARHVRHVVENSRQPLKTRRIIGTQDLREPRRQQDTPDVDLQSLYERVKYVDLADFREAVTEYIESLKTLNLHLHLRLDGNYIFKEAMITAYRIVKEAEGDPDQVLDMKWGEENIGPEDTMEDTLTTVLAIIHRAIRFRDTKGNAKGNPAVNKARQYLEENYSNPNLTFQNVVDFVAMSSSHFSTLFSQSTGTTFTKYLISLRLRKARELLLNTTMRSSEIAYAVGYNDPHYFSYLFKKNIGCTPSEFRNQKNDLEEEKK